MNRPLLLLFSCLVFSAAECRAEDWVMGVHTFSIHSPQRHQSNDNPGLYARKDRWQAGFYRNSHDRTTVYGGYAAPLGPVDLMLALATGYDRRCTQTVTVTPEKVVKDERPDGSTVVYRTPASVHVNESCRGFSKYPVTPIAAFSYAPSDALFPFPVKPRLSFMPGFGKTSSVLHLSVEGAF